MRPADDESNPLDLNNFPEDHTSSRDGGGERKVYECRFCSLKFCKSQALGGHMNRHRQERETETLNRARQLVLTNDHNLANSQGPPPLGCHPITQGNFGDQFRSMYHQPRMLQQLPPPPPLTHQQLLYSSPSRLIPYHSQYPQQQMNDYYVGHALIPQQHNTTNHVNYMTPSTSDSSNNNYTCVGAPVRHMLNLGSNGGGGGGGGGGIMDGSPSNIDKDEGLNCGRQ